MKTHGMVVEVTIEVDVDVEYDHEYDDDGCGSPSKTGNSMTGCRGKYFVAGNVSISQDALDRAKIEVVRAIKSLEKDIQQQAEEEIESR